MKKLKISQKIGIGFIVVIVLCTFFSRTFVYYTTPKVHAQVPNSGVINDDTVIQGRFSYADKKDVAVSSAVKYPLKVTEVYVKNGDIVKKGQVIAKGEASSDLDDQINQLMLQYKSEQIAVNDFDMQVKSAIIEYDKQINTMTDQKHELDLQLEQLKNDKSSGNAYKMEKMKNDMDVIDRELSLLNQEKQNTKKGIVSGKDKSSAADEVNITKNKLYELNNIKDDLTEIKSEYSGTITDIHLKPDEIFNGSTSAYTVNQDNKPVIMGTVSKNDMDHMGKGTECTFLYNNKKYYAKITDIRDQTNSDNASQLLQSRSSIGTDASSASENNDVRSAVIQPEGSFYQDIKDFDLLEGQDIQVSLGGSNQQYNVVVPNSCIIDDEGDKKVYILKNRNSYIGNEDYVIVVKIKIAKSDSVNSAVSDGILPGETVVYSWDRPLAKNQHVINLSSVTDSE